MRWTDSVQGPLRPAKLTLEYVDANKLYVVTGMVSDPQTRLWSELDHDMNITWSREAVYSPQERVYLTFLEDDKGIHYTVNMSDEAFKAGYAKALQDIREKMEDL